MKKNPHRSGLTNLPFRQASPLKNLVVVTGALIVAKGCGRQAKHLAVPNLFRQEATPQVHQRTAILVTLRMKPSDSNR